MLLYAPLPEATSGLIHYHADDTWSVSAVHGDRASNTAIPRVLGRAWAAVLPVAEIERAFGFYPYTLLDLLTEVPVPEAARDVPDPDAVRRRYAVLLPGLVAGVLDELREATAFAAHPEWPARLSEAASAAFAPFGMMF